MVKKVFKLILCLIGLGTVIAGIYYFFSKQNKNNLEKELADKEEEDLETTDFFDLSNLKFSRHYVDLR